ncbi:hypothetical protein ILYODFUR_025383 [Ilyodon furcidens]|uniref:Uncharacterized protein n=1 Tax=Ilyodon furcidens TaxID=33524 RepID=A0ABV0VJR2_9TELE
MKKMLRVLHVFVHFMNNPSLPNDLQRFQRSPQNRASLFKSLALMLLPQQMMKRLIEDMQHLHIFYTYIFLHPANVAGCKLPQEEHSALSLLVDSFTVASPLSSVVQVNTEVFILLHHLHP